MHATPSDGGDASPLRFLLPTSILARRLVVRGVLLYLLMRALVGFARAFALQPDAGAAPPGFALGVPASAVLIAAATGAVLVAERRRGVPPLLLANLGTPPAAAACWIAATLSALEAGGTWLLG